MAKRKKKKSDVEYNEEDHNLEPADSDVWKH